MTVSSIFEHQTGCLQLLGMPKCLDKAKNKTVELEFLGGFDSSTVLMQAVMIPNGLDRLAFKEGYGAGMTFCASIAMHS